MVLASTRPCASDVPSTSTLSPGMSTTSDRCSLSRPNRPLSSFVVVLAVRTTVTFPFDVFTINVSPVREMIIPWTPAPKADAVAKNDSATRLITPVFRLISASLFLRYCIQTSFPYQGAGFRSDPRTDLLPTQLGKSLGRPDQRGRTRLAVCRV